MIVVLLLAAVNYFIFFHDSADYRVPEPAPLPTIVADLSQRGAPGAPGGAESIDDFGEPIGRVITGKLRRGQTVLRALRSEGIDQQSALPLIHAMEKVFDFRRAQVGDAFEANVNDEGQVTRLRYVQSPLEVYEVSLLADGDYAARKRRVPTRIDIAHIGCAIKSSLYESIARCGESAPLAAKVIDLFAWDVDFFQDARQSDELRVIVEKISVDGRFLKYGRILAAEYHGKFGKHRVIAYRDATGRDGYFKPDGRAVTKEFLKSPLKYTRVSASAGSSGPRHPLKRASAMVYTAQADNPVWAVASGTVTFAGDSPTLGKTVTIRHENGFTSTYARLGQISGAIKPGTLVKQKTILGKVGAAKKGSEDNPRIVFSLRKNGQLTNPLTMRFTEGDPVPTEQRDHFDSEVRPLLEDLDTMPLIGVQDRRG